jgi:hypothetical protein
VTFSFSKAGFAKSKGFARSGAERAFIVYVIHYMLPLALAA